MRRIIVWSAMAMVLAGCSTPPSSSEPPPNQYSERSLADYERSLQSVPREAGGPKDADVLLRQRLAADEFNGLSAERQVHWLRISSVLAYQANDLDYAYATSLRTTATEHAIADDWRMRFYCASRQQNLADASHSLETMVERWPDSIRESESRHVAAFVNQVIKANAGVDTQGLLEALFAARFQQRKGLEPSRFWAELARMYLEQGQIERAKEVAGRINSPRTLLAMRVDRRFDPVTSALPERFDMPAAVDREIAGFEQLSRAQPGMLFPILMQAQSLNVARRYDLAIKVIDEVLNDGDGVQVMAQRYADAAENVPWLLNARASALQGLSRWAEAEKYLRASAGLDEAGSENVSQAINLAHLYASLRRSTEAAAQLDAFSGHDDLVSVYGQMQVQSVRVLVAAVNHDDQAMQSALDFLRDKQKDSPATLQRALLDANQLDEAAALLIKRLSDPSLRSDALLDAQEYREVLRTPAAQARQQRWQELRARTDVQAALERVGRVEAVSLDFE